MQPSLHQNPRPTHVQRFLDLRKNHFLRVNIRFLVTLRSVERAKAAILGADICVVNIPVDDVSGHVVRMVPASHRVSGHTEAYQIMVREQLERFGSRQLVTHMAIPGSNVAARDK